MASILRFDNWQNSDGTSIATTDASGNISFAGSLGATAGLGKILQVVRATDTTNRVTSSTSFVDASISVTITPTSASSTVMLIWSFSASQGGANRTHHTQITDSSNNAISGAEDCKIISTVADIILSQTNVAYDSPATTSATTYKGRFKSGNAQNVALTNSVQTGQLYALEIAS